MPSFFKEREKGYLSITQPRIGLHNVKEFKRQLESYLAGYMGEVILDISQLDELDSSGIAVLLQLEKFELDRQAQIRLTGFKEGRVERLFSNYHVGDNGERVTFEEIFKNPAKHKGAIKKFIPQPV